MTAPGSTCSVLCVDDNELVAQSLRRRLDAEPGLAWAGWHADGQRVPDAIRELRPGVVLMDIDMPGVDAFALVTRLARDCPDVRVVMFSGHVQAAFIERALDCGAWGYLSKNDDTSTLIEEIKRVAAGEIVLGREALAVHQRTLA